jgi:hypothetical protein
MSREAAVRISQILDHIEELAAEARQIGVDNEMDFTFRLGNKEQIYVHNSWDSSTDWYPSDMDEWESSSC